MTKPPHICTCGNTIAHGNRCECKKRATRERNKRHDRNRPTASQRGYNYQWRKASKAFLAMHQLCQCGQKAKLVDHIIPHRGDQKLFWDRSNWRPLCTHCHSKHKQILERNFSS